jgi:LemA protein
VLLTRIRQLRKSRAAGLGATAITPPWQRRRLSDRLAAVLGAHWPWKLLGILAGLLLIVSGAYYYNTFVALQQRVKTARAQIDSAVQMRRNLVPVLRAVVGELVGHEDDIFLHAADARAESVSGPRRSVRNVARAAGNTAAGDEFGQLLSKLLAISERYPDLKTGEPFQLLMGQLTDVEGTVLEKRVAYNEAVNIYNAGVTSFPGGTFALVFGFRRAEWFQQAGASEWSPVELHGMPPGGEKRR